MAAVALPAVIATAINSALIIGLSILFVEIGSGSAQRARRVVGGAALAVVRGPLFIVLLAGILWSASGLGLPMWISNFAGLMGDASGPCALFAMGFFLVGKPISTGLGEVSWLVIAKLVLHPLVIWILAVQVFCLDAEFTRGAVLMAALPTGALSFVIAQKYGVFVQRSSATILVSTVLSVVTVSALLAHFGIS
jgi:malonate transporter